jgi:hypothetical protein
MAMEIEQTLFADKGRSEREVDDERRRREEDSVPSYIFLNEIAPVDAVDLVTSFGRNVTDFFNHSWQPDKRKRWVWRPKPIWGFGCSPKFGCGSAGTVFLFFT